MLAISKKCEKYFRFHRFDFSLLPTMRKMIVLLPAALQAHSASVCIRCRFLWQSGYTAIRANYIEGSQNGKYSTQIIAELKSSAGGHNNSAMIQQYLSATEIR